MVIVTLCRDGTMVQLSPPLLDTSRHDSGQTALELKGVSTSAAGGAMSLHDISLKIRSGEILGIAGVSGNGQSQLVEALTGQRPIKAGQVLVRDQNFEPKRDHFDKFKVFGLPEEPLKNATAPTMSVAENMAFRSFDKPPIADCRPDCTWPSCTIVNASVVGSYLTAQRILASTCWIAFHAETPMN